MSTPNPSAPSSRGLVKKAGLLAGPLLGVLVYYLLPGETLSDAGEVVGGLSHAGRGAASIGVLMACWWLTEAISIPATALVPVVLFPVVGVMDVQTTAARYAHEMILLFFGGFALGLAMEKHGLHKRIALFVVRLVGTSPGRLVAGFMLASAVLSAWVSNTATTLMMLPIGMSVVALVLPDEPTQQSAADGRVGRNFATGLMLGIAYASSIGGMVTLIGTPPNLVLAGYAKDSLGLEISMARWILVVLPMAALFLPVCWILLTKLVFPIRVKEIAGVDSQLKAARIGLGPMKLGEAVVLVVFCLTALAWVLRPQIQALGAWAGLEPIAELRDSSIAVVAAMVLFVFPTDWRRGKFVMDWKTAERMPWGILILFGGGLALAKAIADTGVDAFIGQQMTVLEGAPTVVVILVVALAISALSQIASNTAIANAVLPVLAAAAPAIGLDPMRLLVPATIAASLAFMLPVATPPNAIVFGSGRVTVGQMAKAGLWLNLIGVALACIAGYFFAGYVVTPNG